MHKHTTMARENAGERRAPALEQKERVRDFFETSQDWQGGMYDNQKIRFHRAVMRRKEYAIEMLGEIPSGPKGKALDIGCGCGAYTEELMRMGYDTFATDLAQGMLDTCRERLHLSDAFFQQHFRRGDIEALPFDNRSFDLVVSVGVFGYLLSDIKALSEVRRVLRPGGHFLVSVQNMHSLSNLDYVFRRRLGLTRGTRVAPTFLSVNSSGTDIYSRGTDIPVGQPANPSGTDNPCRTDIPVGQPSRTADGNGGPAGRPFEAEGVAMEIPWVAANSQTHHFYKAYFPRSFERMMQRNGFWLVDAMTLGHEFRLVRRFGLLPETLLTHAEIWLEQLFWHKRIPLLRYSGEAYTALFRLM